MTKAKLEEILLRSNVKATVYHLFISYLTGENGGYGDRGEETYS